MLPVPGEAGMIRPVFGATVRVRWPLARSFGYDGGMEANTKRSWYRLHWGTVLVVALASVAWIDLAFPGTVGAFLLGDTGDGYAIIEGWPWCCVSGIGDGFGHLQVSYSFA